MTERLAFLGGSFDPVHHGHLIVARSIAEQLGLQRIVLVPARQSPHKPGIHASSDHRLAMIKAAIAGEGIFDVDDLELVRHGPSYTIDTLEQLRRQHPQARLAWVIGADMLEDLPKWHRVKDLLDQFELIIAARPLGEISLDAALAKLESLLGSQALRLRQWVVQTPLIDISSTEIRRRIAQGQSINYLLPTSVINYIHSNKLYTPAQ